MILFRVWKDAIKDNWQDTKTIEEANAIDFGFGFDEVELNTWSKEAHLQEINDLHEAEFERRLQAANYVNGWEVVACAADPLNEYSAEAKTLLAYWFDGWNAIETYGQTVTEQNAQDPQTFVNGL